MTTTFVHGRTGPGVGIRLALVGWITVDFVSAFACVEVEDSGGTLDSMLPLCRPAYVPAANLTEGDLFRCWLSPSPLESAAPPPAPPLPAVDPIAGSCIDPPSGIPVLDLSCSSVVAYLTMRPGDCCFRETAELAPPFVSWPLSL